MLTRAKQQGGRPGKALRGHVSVPLFRNAYLLITSSMLSSALGFPFWALAARLYGAGTVGRASALLSAMSVIAGVAQLGLPSVLIRYLPSSGSGALRYVVRSYGIATAGALTLGVVAAASTGVWSPSLRFVSTEASWFALFVLGIAISPIASMQDSVLMGLRRTTWVPVENTFSSVLRIGLIVALVTPVGHSAVVLSSVVALIASMIPVNIAIFTRFLPRFMEEHRSTVRLWGFRDIRRLAIGNYVGDLSSLVITYTLPVIVLDLKGARQAAYFYVPWMVSLAMRFIAQNMSNSMTVEIALSEESTAANLRKVASTLARLLIPLTALVIVVAPFALDLFGHMYARSGSSSMRLLALGVLPNAVAMVGLAIARLRHDGRLVAAIQTVDALTMLGATFLLLPVMGIEGAALAWLVAQSLAALISARPIWGAFRSGLTPSDSPDAS